MKYSNADEMNFEKPLITLVWLTSIVSIILTYIASYFLISLQVTKPFPLTSVFWFFL